MKGNSILPFHYWYDNECSFVETPAQDVQDTKLKLSKEEEALFDDDDLEDDELDELEAKLEETNIN